MKRRKVNIRKSVNSNGTYSIWIDNARLCPNIFHKISQILECFTEGTEVYLGCYKTDGVNISGVKFNQYGQEIRAYFEKNGQRYQILETFWGKGKRHSCSELLVYSAPNNNETYRMIEKVFHYYLEIIVFSPKVDWDTFVHSYSNYMNIVIKDYVLNGYTNFLFSYVDSGDFSITFDPKRYDSKMIQEQVYKIIFEE